MASRGLLDTCVFIASESGRSIDQPVVTQDEDFAPVHGAAGLVVVTV
jgi:hypothetical protein